MLAMILLSLLLSPCARAQDLPAHARLTDELAASLALSRSPEVRAARARAAAAQAAARLDSRPQDPRLTAMDLSGPGGRNEQIGVDFDLWSLIGYASRRRAGQAQSARAAAELAESALDLEAEAKSAFYEVQAASASVALCRDRRREALASAQWADAQSGAGDVARLDAQRLRADAEESALAVDDGEARLEMARARLARLMRVPAEADWGDVGAPQPPAGVVPDAAALTTMARARRPRRAAALAAARAARAAAFDRGNRAFGDFRGGVAYEYDLGARLVGPSLQMNVPATGRGSLGMDQARAQAEEADARADEDDAEIEEDVRALSSRLDSAARRARRLDAAVLPLRESIVAELSTRPGARPTSRRELSAAKDQEISSRLRLIEARRDYWTARAELERAVGGSLDATEVQP
ncbi:MAG: TolC family protein [Elusimicrobia bacterium]|nr:TolC family protein [Elusimicrobiota bacterium]